jgi:regulator of nucleoside diphosphate kinase
MHAVREHLTNPNPALKVASRDYDRLADMAETALSYAPALGRFLLDELERAEIVADAELPPTVVGMYSEIEFRNDESGEVRTVTLVYPGEQDIAAGRVSIMTPVGAALIGLAEGDSIRWDTRDGKSKRLTVLRVRQTQP